MFSHPAQRSSSALPGQSSLRPPRNAPTTRRLVATSAALVTLAVLGACADAPTDGSAVDRPTPQGPVLAGAYRLTISGVGTDAQVTTIEADEHASSASAGLRASRSATGAFLAPDDRGLTARPSATFPLQMQRFITGSYTYGTRGQPDAYRYVYAAFRVRNGSGVALTNLSLLGIGTPTSLGGSAISNLALADGTPPAGATAIAQAMAPAGASIPGRTGNPTGLRTDVLQIFSEADVAASGIGSPFTPLPYAFTVLDTLTDGRTIAANASGVFPNVVVFAFRVPLQATAAQDVFTFTFNFFAVTDAETRVTESPEERDATSSAAVAARATAISAVALHAFRGTPQTGNALARLYCAVRSAGTFAAPTAYLGTSCSNEVAGFLVTETSVNLTSGASQQLHTTLAPAGGFSPPTGIAFASANPAVAAVSATGLVTGRAAGTTTIYVGPLAKGETLYAIPVTVQ